MSRPLPAELGLSPPKVVRQTGNRQAVPAVDIPLPVGSNYTHLSELLSVTNRGVTLDFKKLKVLQATRNHPKLHDYPAISHASLAAAIPVSSLSPFSWIFSKSPRIQRLWSDASPTLRSAVEENYEDAQRVAITKYVTRSFHKFAIATVPESLVSVNASRKVFRDNYVLDSLVFTKLNFLALDRLNDISLLLLPTAGDVERYYLSVTGSRELVDVENFHAIQINHREEVKKVLTEWLRESKELITSEMLRPAFRTFVSLKMRELVTRTVDAYCGLIKSFASSSTSLILNKLIVKNDDFRLKHTTEVVAERITRIFKETLLVIRSFPEISEVRDVEDFVLEALDELEAVLVESLSEGERKIREFQPYVGLISELARARGVAESGGVAETDAYIGNLLIIKADLKAKFPRIIPAALMAVDCGEVVQSLIDRVNECIALVLKSKAFKLGASSGTLSFEAESYVAQVRKKVSNEETLLEIKTLISTFDCSLKASLLERYKLNKQWFDLIYERKYLLEVEDYRSITAAAKAINEAVNFTLERKTQLTEERDDIESKFFARREKFVAEIAQFPTQIARFRDFSNYKLADDYQEKVEVFLDAMRRSKQEAADINIKEQQLGWETSDFDVLIKAEIQIDPINRLWAGVCEFNRKQTQWSRSAVLALDIPAIEADMARVEELATELESLIEFAAENIKQLKTSVENFRQNLPIIKFLCDDRLDDAAWEQISEILGFPVDSDTNYSLVKFLDMGIVDRFDDLLKILD